MRLDYVAGMGVASTAIGDVSLRFTENEVPTKEELSSFLNRRQISESSLQRPELQRVSISTETNRWICDFELDRENLVGA